MFVEEDLLTIVIYYQKEGLHYLAFNEKTFNDMELSEEDKNKYKKLTVKARQLTWGLYNDLQESAMVEDELGNRRWNYKIYKENKLRKIIAAWDAKMKNENDEMVKAPINPKTIGKMAPEIAEVLLNTYDQMTLIDGEEEKKS
jgi:hypothetical protein